jgi:HSP20 family protein
MTTLVRWEPFSELESIRSPIRRMLGEIGFAPALTPAADIFETSEEFVLELDVPGYVEDDLGLEVTDHVVTITGRRHETTEETEKTFRLRERLDRSFERRFELSHDVDTKRLEAAFKNGVLKVHAPKQEVSKPRKIKIPRG